MSKTIILCTMLVLATNEAFCTSIGKLFSKYVHKEKATVKRPTQSNNKKIREFNKLAKDDRLYMRSVLLLQPGDCPEQVSENFRKDLDKVSLDEYEPMMCKNDGDTKIEVLLNRKEDIVRDMVLVMGERSGLIRIRGAGNFSNLSKLDFQIDGIGNMDFED